MGRERLQNSNGCPEDNTEDFFCVVLMDSFRSRFINIEDIINGPGGTGCVLGTVWAVGEQALFGAGEPRAAEEGDPWRTRLFSSLPPTATHRTECARRQRP